MTKHLTLLGHRMTRIFTTLLFIGLAWGQNPCEDERYLRIKEKPLDNMSEREWEYFILKEKQCGDYNINMKNEFNSSKIKNDYVKESKKKRPSLLNKT